MSISLEEKEDIDQLFKNILLAEIGEQEWNTPGERIWDTFQTLNSTQKGKEENFIFPEE